jgi:curli biogenesis system outer membrane secretion channel CsgG
MRFLTLAIAVSAAILAFPAPSSAQIWTRLTNPKVKINVQHPPYIALKGVTRVAVSEFQGECGAELTDRLTELVARSGKFEVLDRFNLERVLTEQDFNFSGRVDGRSAVRLGKILGPAALIFGRVSRCRSEANNQLYRKDFRGNIIYMARTRANVTASVQLVELATSRVLSAQTFDGASERTAESREGRPEAPDSHTVMTDAYEDLLRQVSRLILPWNETVEMLVYDDEKWQLKAGAKMMKAGDFTGAAAHFETILKEHADPNEKDWNKLHYKVLHNLGTAMTYAGHPNAAIPHFQASLKEKEQDVTAEALATARKISGLQAAFRMQELRAVAIDTGAEPAEKPKPAQPAPVTPVHVKQEIAREPAPAVQPAARPAAKAPPKPAAAPAKRAPTIEEQLAKLKELFRKGLITQQDYDEQRKALIKRLAEGDQ